MTRFQLQILYGILIAATGIFLLLLSYNPSRLIQFGVAAGIFLSACLAFFTVKKSKGLEIPLKYNWLLGVGMLAYALCILIYASTFVRFITVTIAFLFYFGASEIMFGFELLAYKKSISVQIIVLRMVIGFLMTIAAVSIFVLAFLDKNISLSVAGGLIFLSGISFVLFANTVRRNARLKNVA